MVGDFRFQRPTKLQYEAATELTKALIKELNLSPDDVWGHSQFPGYARKQCPVINMDQFRSDLTAKEVDFMKVAKLTAAQERMRQRLVRAGLLSPDYEIKEHELALMSIIDILNRKLEQK